MAYNFEILGVYQFDVYAPAVLNAAQYQNVTLTGIVSYDDAKLLENIDLKYRQVYPAMPPGTPDAPKLQKYYVFRTQSGQRVVLCGQWIIEDSIEEINLINFSVDFTNQTVESVEQVRRLLVAAGYTSFNIRQSNA